MKKGGKRLIIVPPKLAYGDKGAGNKVPPGATLIFHVEVVRVKLAKDKDAPSSGRTSPAPATAAAAPATALPQAAGPSGQEEGEEEEEAGVKARTKSISEQLQQVGFFLEIRIDAIYEAKK